MIRFESLEEGLKFALAPANLTKTVDYLIANLSTVLEGLNADLIPQVYKVIRSNPVTYSSMSQNQLRRKSETTRKLSPKQIREEKVGIGLPVKEEFSMGS